MADSSGDATAVPEGALAWFPSAPPIPVWLSQWRLDVVTLLAVIGESSMAEHSQTITASFLCLLPRILPAPQALLKPARPPRMPETPAKISGVYSGVVLDTVGFFANIIQPLDDLPTYSFKALAIRHRQQPSPGAAGTPANSRAATTAVDAAAAAATTGSNTSAPDLERQTATIRRRRSISEKVTDFVTNPSLTNREHKRPAVPVRLTSPVHILSLFSCLLSVVLVIMAGVWHDAIAVMAVGLVSLASSVVGYASWWQPILMNVTHNHKLPPGDLIIRTSQFAFLYIKCEEPVTRELFGTDECKYRVGDRLYRFLMGIGTILLMVSVVLLGNCSWNMQLFIGVSYITLNGLYWAMGMLPKKLFWDLSRYEWNDITPLDARGAEITKTDSDSREDVASFTRTLWYAIRETKRTAWVKRSGTTPDTPQWRQWLEEAEKEAKAGNRNWEAVARKDKIMRIDEDDPNPGNNPDRNDSAEQHAPLTEVQNRRGSVVPNGTL